MKQFDIYTTVGGTKCFIKIYWSEKVNNEKTSINPAYSLRSNVCSKIQTHYFRIW